MSTAREPGKPDADENAPYWVGDGRRNRLNTSRTDFSVVWQRYYAVIRELEMTAAELEALRSRSE